jgi:molybdopterin-containing oxidoreductase family membrane subunit
MATRVVPELPYGVGKTGPGFYALVAGLLALVILGVVAYSRQFIEGEVVTGLRNIGTMGGATWGLYIAFLIYFEGVAFAGIGLAAIIRVFNLDYLRPVARMGIVLTVVGLVLAGASVIVDLGQPVRGFINLFRYARPESPFYGTFAVGIVGLLFVSLIYLYLDGRRDAARLARFPSALAGFFGLWASGYGDSAEEKERHGRASFWLALALIPLLVVAHSTLGFVFGIQGGAARWYSALQAPSFLVLAGVSGVGHVIVMAAIARFALNLRAELPIRVFVWLANALWILLAVYLYFLVVELLTATYSGQHNEISAEEALLTGPYAWMFWGMVGILALSLVALLSQFLARRFNLWSIVVAAILVNVVAIAERLLLVLPSQTHGRLLPYDTGSYTPTWVEYSIIIGLMALGALAMVAFFKVFPIMSMPESEETASAQGRALEEADHA